MPSISPLSSLNNDADVLRDLRRRVREMKAAEKDSKQGYSACIKFYERILECVPDIDYESIYRAAAAGVTMRNTEIDRLQRIIYDNVPNAVELINEAPQALGRNVVREHELKLKTFKNKLKDGD